MSQASKRRENWNLLVLEDLQDELRKFVGKGGVRLILVSDKNAQKNRKWLCVHATTQL